MVFGLRNVELAHHENDEKSDGAMTTNLVEKRWSNPIPNSNYDQVEIKLIAHLRAEEIAFPCEVFSKFY